jgi:hypothetical protein
VIKTVRREGGDLGDERMVGVKQETKVPSSRRGEERKREGLGDFRELDRVPISKNSVLDGLRERRLEDIQSAKLEKREPRRDPRHRAPRRCRDIPIIITSFVSF